MAIVTPVAGTTRDAIRQHIEIAGVALHFIDTAGLRDTDDEVETIGIARTWSAIRQANAALLLVDAAKGIAPADLEIMAKLPPSQPLLRVFNKIDLLGQTPRVDAAGGSVNIYLSAKTGAGIDLLHEHLLQSVGWQAGGEGVFMARDAPLERLARSQGTIGPGGRLQGPGRVFCGGAPAGPERAFQYYRRIYI